MQFYSNSSQRQIHPFFHDTPKEDWKRIMAHLSNSNIVSYYFIDRSVMHGLPTGDFKAMVVQRVKVQVEAVSILLL